MAEKVERAEMAEQTARATIPAIASERLVMMAGVDSAEAEAYRTLRTFLRFNSRLDMGGGVGRAVLLADGGEVRDHAAAVANLAIAFARAGERVIAVDADLRGSGGAESLSSLFGQGAATTGLAAMLGGLGPERKIILPLVETGVANLLVLPAGPRLSGPAANPADLLGAETTAVLVAALRAQADIVLFDAPPVAAFADARAIAARVDATLLLVAQGVTRRPTAQAALAALQQVGAVVLGVVLTGAK